MIKHTTLASLVVSTLLLFPLSLFAATNGELILSTAPTQSHKITKQLYGPLAQYLSTKTGKRVILKPAHNFIGYSSKLRHDRFDIVFDGPHLSAWRIAKHGHQPIARFPGDIQIVVATKEDSPFKTLDDLINARVCAFASPNMLTMAFMKHFTNPVRQPFMLRAQGFKGLQKCLRGGRGEVVVLRDKHWKKMDQKGLRLIPVPKHSYPERTFTVSQRVDDQTRDQIRDALLSQEGKKVTAALLKRFKKDHFVAAESKDYDTLDELLYPVWGFRE